MRKPGFSFVVRQKQRQITVVGAAGPRGFKVINTNELLGETGVTGIKTGTTAAAGPCLATNVERDALVQDQPNGPNNGKLVTPRRLIVVVLNSPDRFGRTRALIPQGWAKFDQWKEAGSPVGDARREFLVVPEVP
jgi:D-alanyl-D-alanine carboxypeptidase (penicillin-binding protein 5/6)